MKQINLPEFSVIVIISKDEEKRKNFMKQHFTKEEYFIGKQLEDTLEPHLEDAKVTVIDIKEIKNPICEMAVRMAKRYYCVPIAIMLDNIDDEVIKSDKNKHKDAKEHIKNDKEVKENNKVQDPQIKGKEVFENTLRKRGFEQIYLLEEDGQTFGEVVLNRTVLKNNQLDNQGPFDIIGDIHGCYDELCELLEKLGYQVDQDKDTVYSPAHRTVIFCGDLVDRGPKVTKVLKLVMHMVKERMAYCVLGNHDGKLLRKLKGSNVQVIHGLEVTLEQLDQESDAFKEEVRVFLEGLVSHYVFDQGRLVVAHAGLKERMHGRETKKVRDLAMFGETTGKLDEYGLPQRLNWSENYKGNALVVYGHTPRIDAKLINHTINVDTGCVYGGKLTAFRYPEQDIVSVNAKDTYYESTRPLIE